jgi:hypothetical protein
MYQTGNTNWRSRLFFLCVGLFFTWAVYYLSTGSIDPAYYWYNRSAVSPAVAATQPRPNARMLLDLNEPFTAGKIRLTYKGTQDGCFLIDVVIPDLDQGFAYHHQIPLKTARQGFNLAGTEFVFISANRRSARIKPVASE